MLPPSPTTHQRSLRVRRNTLMVAAVWTTFIAASLGWSFFEQRRGILGNARREAQISFQQAMLFRFWTNGHGSAAPATDNAPPSADLARAEKLGSAFPAAMLSQILGRSPGFAGYRGRLTSLKPLEPKNTPDAWEAGALQAFAKGQMEVASVATMEGQEYLRVMWPLVKDASCVSCHDAGNYGTGEVRGGMSVSVPLAPLVAREQRALAALVSVDGIIWLLGLGVIGFAARRAQAHNREQMRNERVLRESEARYRTLADSGQALIWTSGPGGQCDYFNQPWLTFMGRTLEQELHDGWAGGVHPDDRSRCLETFASAFDRRAAFSMVYRRRRHDGEFRWLQNDASPRHDSEGNFVGYIGHCLDITERKQAEAELQLSQQRLALHIERTPLAVIEFDPTGRVRQWNPAAVEMFGYSREEASGREWTFIVPEPMRGQMAAVWSAIVDQGGGIRCTNENLMKDGREITCEWFNTQLVDAGGRTIGVASLVQDVSERKRTEVALRQSEQHYRSLFDNMLNGYAYCRMIFVDGRAEDFTYLSVNRTFETLTGLKDVEGRNASVVIPGLRQSDPELLEAYGRVALTGVPEQFENFVEALAMWFFISVYSPGKGYFVAVFDVITERKRSESALRASEERYRSLFESNPLPMWLYDPATLRFLAVNESAVTHYGYTREEFLAMTIKDIRPTEDLPTLSKFIDENLPAHSTSEWRHRRKDGAIIRVEIVSRPLPFEGRDARLVLASDITDKRLLEEKFLHAQRLESLGMLAAGIAHDLNNVLAPIVFAAPLLRDSLSTPRDLKILATLEQSAGRGTGLVKQILGFAHSTAGEFQATQVKHLVRDIIGIVEETFPKSIEVEHHVPSNLWPVHGNATQIHQVLMNLCVNARDALPQGGTLRIRAANRRLDDAEASAIPGARPGAWLVLEVSDTGTGIPPGVLERIWTPFFTTKAAGKGTGLGLSTVRSIVLSHHGFIELDTGVGRGSTFRVFLPAIESATPVARGVVASAIPRGHGEFILVVDDDAGIRRMVCQILELHGYRSVGCADGVEAIDVFNSHLGEISLVVTDVDMPRLGGVALAQALLPMRPDLRLLAISGLSRSSTGISDLPAIQELAHAFLLKPFTHEDLLGAVHRLLHPPENN